MTRGSRIVAVETDEVQAASVVAAVPDIAEAPAEASEDWYEPEAQAVPRPWFAILAGAMSAIAVVGWTGLVAYTHWPAMRGGAGLEQWVAWVRDWSVPVLLVAVLWLLAMRNSRREALRFAQAARSLSDESAALELRLTTINRELSLAREFLSAQSRDLDALGRMATERLSEHSGKLAELIHDNSSRIDAIGDVSTAALDNMEKLRGQLPVIASSAKDVTNNIAAAGRTAHAQIEELVSGFNRLNEFGKASERQVHSLRDTVDKSLGEFTRQTEALEGIARERFAALAERGAEFRTQLESHEVEALAAIRSRATALTEELEGARSLLDSQEAEVLTSLRARLTAVRDESTMVGRTVREAEERALDSWKASIARLEEDLRSAIHQVGEIDEKAMESARKRLTALADEAKEVDERMAERDRQFGAEIERRQAEYDERQARFIERLTAQMAGLDAQLTERREAEEEHGAKLIARGEAISAKLGDFTAKIAEVSTYGDDAERSLVAGLAVLTEKLAASREALTGTDSTIATLTESSVRLLELIQASVQHTTVNLPAAMDISATRLTAIEERVQSLRDSAGAAEASGAALGGHAAKAGEELAGLLEKIEALHTAIGEKAGASREDLAAMQSSLEALRGESLALAETAQEQLRKSIEELNASARAAVGGIEEMSAASVGALAARIGEESGAAIDQVMRARAGEVAGQLEEAAAQAAAVSRDAAIQLRDQLAKVSELTGHLERRVAHARTRAEEQVDNDFSRRVALISESLNSNAIDIAKAMDVDVADTAWAQYLKGDRGIFTRRAVKLLDTPQAKAVMQLYESDRTFRDHVSRYVHDFEAMLRQLLSTRDGHALGVTVLSSDMGKLYVALAQAIERLRN
jgi:hypothetical protein